LIAAVALLRRSVEEEMADLGKTYRETMPPCLLQLYPWAYPKGSPPRALYWVRLARRQDEFDHQLLVPLPVRRPRWCKRLKIRNRSDLGSAIYWNGATKRRKSIMAFHDRAGALNKAHRTLAREMAYAKYSLKSPAAAPDRKEGLPLELVEDPSLHHLGGKGTDLIFLAWGLEQAIEESLIALENFRERTLRLRFRLTFIPGPAAGTLRMEWEDRQTGRKYRGLDGRALKNHHLSPEESATFRPLGMEFKRLSRMLLKRTSSGGLVETRLSQALEDARETLGSCPRIPNAIKLLDPGS
jgi:hypothetical protein